MDDRQKEKQQENVESEDTRQNLTEPDLSGRVGNATKEMEVQTESGIGETVQISTNTTKDTQTEGSELKVEQNGRSKNLTGENELQQHWKGGNNQNLYTCKKPTKADFSNIIPFDPNSGVEFQAWLNYFNKLWGDIRVTEETKIEIFSNCLKGFAQQIFINSCLHCKEFAEVVEIFNENFYSPDITSFAEYTSIKFNGCSKELQTYFRNKMEMGRKLNLNTNLLLEGLTSGLPQHLRSLIVIKEPKTPKEWLEVVAKLSHDGEEKQNSNKIQTPPKVPSQEPRQQPMYKNYTPQQPTYRNYTPRQPMYRNYTPQQPMYRNPWNYRPQFNHNNENRNPRLQTPNMTHFQERAPSQPCRHCEKIGVYNAFHWGQTCRFRPNQCYNTDQETINPEVATITNKTPDNSS